VAIVPVTSAPLLSTSAELTPAVARQDKVNPVGTAKTALDMEAYTKELRVLQPARQAVARGDFASAMSAIGEHQSLFPSGKLVEEREALRIKALLGLGRATEAQRAGAAFRARFPHSALLKRIDEMLGTQK
jgi:TolA-binding protein